MLHNNKDSKSVNSSAHSYSNLYSDSASSDSLEVKRHYIGHVDEAHHFVKDNEFIFHGYRINFHTCPTIMKSLCMCHNETVNIWTHLVGALLTLIFIIVTGLNVGPYGKELNDAISPHIITYRQEALNYTEPFLNSKPILHNSIFLLNNLISKTDIIETRDKFIEILFKQKEKYDVLLEKIQDMTNLNANSTNSDGVKQLNCFSCIQDFMENLLSVKTLLGHKNVTIIESDILKTTLDYWRLTIDKINDTIFKTTENLRNVYNFENFEMIRVVKENNFSGISITSFQLDKWPIYVHLLSAIFCLCCSSFYHLFSAHTPKINEFFARLDYAGISILIAGSCYAPYYYLFYCTECKLIFD